MLLLQAKNIILVEYNVKGISHITSSLLTSFSDIMVISGTVFLKKKMLNFCPEVQREVYINLIRIEPTLLNFDLGLGQKFET